MNKPIKVDPLTLAVVEARMKSLNEELGARLFRQCFSVPTSHIRDVGTVLFDKDERTLNIGNFMPVHTGGSDISLKGMLDALGRDNIYPDDFIIGNDPFVIRFGHAADWSFMRPIFYKGELLFYHFARTHQYDSGGAFPGCYFPRAYDYIAEGLILPPIKLMERGKINETAYSVILRNLRGSALVRADNMLVYESMKIIEKRIFSLLDEYGKNTVMAACSELMDKARSTVKNIISQWPAGTYRAERAADWDGTTDQPVWVRLSMTVKPKAGKLIFDFTNSDPQVDFINVCLGQVWSSVSSGLLWCMPPGVPRNNGFFDCFEVKTKAGTVCDPIYPATSSAQSVTLGQEITECVMLAMGQVVPKETPATWGRHVNPLYACKRRDIIDPRTGYTSEYTAHTFHAVASSGAAWGNDATDGNGSSPLGGAHIRAPIEVEEWYIPYRWLHYEFLADSGGAGRWRGGLGTHVDALNVYDRKVWKPLDCLTMTGNADGEKFNSVGILGGKGGTFTRMEVVKKGKHIPYHTMDLQYLEPGDRMITNSGGGGGVGDPLDREVEKVRVDALNEYVSLQAARGVYGVVIDPKTFEVDEKATKVLRAKLKKSSSKNNH